MSFQAGKILDHGVNVIHLTDTERSTNVLIAPSVGNRAYAMSVGSANILYMPAPDISQLKSLSGIPFLAPWANRIPGGGFRANGNWYALNESLGVLRMHPHHIAIHGMLTSSDLWKVSDTGADERSAWVTSRLEFWRYPKLMANWPFAHEYEMTYRLTADGLETSVGVTNLSAEPMPVVIGFHPYVTIPGSTRKDWLAHIPARLSVVMDEYLCATGEMRPNTLPDPAPLISYPLDEGFTDLVREPDGSCTFWVAAGSESDSQRIEVKFGPKWPVSIVYAPADHDFICFEPMAGVTNAVNLGAEGKYSDLQMLPSGDTWRDSFLIRAVNFQI